VSYYLNQKIPQLATVGIGNVSLETAANLWKGSISVSKLRVNSSAAGGLCWGQAVCDLGNTSGGPIDAETADIPNPFGYQAWCFDTPDGKCHVSAPSEEESYQLLAHQLLNNKINIEYVAANLEAGALRAKTIGLQPSAFNVATWHLRGIQSDDEIMRAQPPWRPCPYGACFILEEISSALTAWGIASSWNLSSEPQYAYWKYH
jgi:hypothetical protein